MPVTPERAAVFLDALRKTGSYHAAASAASPHLVRKGSGRYGVKSFRDYARRNPEFAAEVEMAMSEAVGRMEELLVERAMTPDERPVFNQKTGQLLGVQKDSRPANTMLALWLASHDPAKWAPKQHVKSDVTVTNTNTDLTSGANYVIRPDDILLLPDADQRTLVELLTKIEAAREEQNADALPEPRRPYDTSGWGHKSEPAEAAALPGPVAEDDTHG